MTYSFVDDDDYGEDFMPGVDLGDGMCASIDEDEDCHFGMDLGFGDGCGCDDDYYDDDDNY